MNTNTNTTSLPCVATIGFFDGVHQGHLHLINEVKKTATEKGFLSCIITFDEHPRQVLRQEYQPLLLNTREEKIRRLVESGADNIKMLHFDEQLARLSARDFMQNILKEKLNVKSLLIGYDNRFGHNREDNFINYVEYGRELGIDVIKATPLIIGEREVSSSRIRRLLQSGNIEEANRLLGYKYELQGVVVHGNHLGRTLGFPTANMEHIDTMKLIPADGVYSVDVRGRKGMTNIGKRPTFYDNSKVTIETNIRDFNDDIYGEVLTIEFNHRLRDERKFSSREDLISQLNKDINYL